MEVLFFRNFSKRENSTKQPNDEDGELREVRLKGQCDVRSPMFFLTGADDYVYCKAWNNYYFIHRVGYDIDGAQYVYCNIDYLATWRAQIMATNAFVLYSSSNYNRWIKDDRCPIVIKDSEYVFSQSAITYGGDTLFFASENETVLLTTISEAFGLWTWVIDESSLETIMHKIFTNQTILDALLDQFGDINNAIVSVIRLPIRPAHIVDTHDSVICIGSEANVTDEEYSWLGKKHIQCSGSIGIPATYTDYRYTEPYCKARMTIPFVGVVDFPLSELVPEGGINWQLDIELLTGICTYTFYSGSTNKIVASYSGNCGGNIPIANIQVQNPAGASARMAGGLMASGAMAASGNLVGGIGGGIASIVGGFFGFSQDHATVIGSYSGGRPEWTVRELQLCVEKFKTAEEPANLTPIEGRPLCKVVNLATLTGYCRTQNFSIDIVALDADRQAINRMMDSGVYLE